MGFLGDSGCVTSSKQAVGSASLAAYVPNTITHCVRPIQNWIQERVRGVSGHQERPKAFPMTHMNRMVIVYKHTVQGKRL